MTIEVRWFLADGTPADPANPQLREHLAATVGDTVRSILRPEQDRPFDDREGAA